MADREFTYASKPLVDRARDFRKEPTPSEAMLWRRLRSGALGVRFRRQHPVEGYILDFYCHEALLVVELDGSHHQASEQREYDEVRTQVLEAAGLLVLRFSNAQVLSELSGVLEVIAGEVQRRLPSP